MTQIVPQSGNSWLSREELDSARERLPILYVDAIPVRVDETGTVGFGGSAAARHRPRPDQPRARQRSGALSRAGAQCPDPAHREGPRPAGPAASARLPAPFTVAEYFPTPGVTPFHDPRQHAVSLAFVVPVEGDREPSQDALELSWFSPDEARQETVLVEMAGGQGTLLKQALAHCGF